MRVVLDSNILVSALLSPAGAPARLLARWLAGDCELIASNRLLEELGRVLVYPKLRARVDSEDAGAIPGAAAALGRELRGSARPASRSSDPGDDYLIALAADASAALASGDVRLLGLARSIPVYSAQGFLDLLDST